ncbi:MAG: VWA domain-containing protein [Alphaproteobacteria bacterium]|nr:VWA domain-containing protein [Alphaproteobacteria bacterium]
MSKDRGTLVHESGATPPEAVGRSADVARFVEALRATPRAGSGRGRLIFALDATASREPTWDRACHIQAEMFEAAASAGSAAGGAGGALEIQLVFYRGFGECKAAAWASDPATLLRQMQSVRCLPGQTQLVRVLDHARKEAAARKVDALVFVGDMMEEDIDALGQAAGGLGLAGVPCFIFHEGGDPVARRAFQHVARLTRGACVPFDSSSADQLRELLKAVAVYAAGGYKALQRHAAAGSGPAALLTHALKR